MIRAVLFDAFGTLYRPRVPIHVQYAQLAESYGLLVEAEDVKSAIKKAFKDVGAHHPLYGKFSKPPLHYEDWWALIIERTFQYADVPESDLQITLPTLIPALIHRFASKEGYVLHNDVVPCLQALKDRSIPIGIISNSDPRTIKVTESLGVVPHFIPSENITLSWDVGHSKPAKELFQAACQNLGFPASETLMVGDDLDEDYLSSKAAGLHSVLVKRDTTEADWVRRETSQEELQNLTVVKSMEEILALIERSNNKQT